MSILRCKVDFSSSTVYAEKNDRSLTLNNWILRKDRAMKLMAYERTWPNVQYDWVSLSYHENSSSGLVFYKNKNIAHISQPVSPVLTGLLTGLKNEISWFLEKVEPWSQWRMTEHGQMLYMTGFHCPTTKNSLSGVVFYLCVGLVRFFRIYCSCAAYC